MRLIGLIIALVLAVGAGYVVLSIMQDDDPAPQGLVRQASNAPAYEEASVLVASQPIPVGEVLREDMLSPQPWPRHLVLEGFVTTGEQSASVLGMVTRSNFQQGEPIILSKLANPEDPNFLAAALESGRKVATIQVDNISSVAGFIFPGDHVDVLVTHELPIQDPEEWQEKKESVTETLLSNIKVLAVDNRSTAGAEPQEENGKRRPPTSVSLEVSLEEAQKLRLGQETGYVSLALRSLKDKEIVDTAEPTEVKDLTQTTAYDGGEKNGKRMPIRVVRGTKIEDITSETQMSKEEEPAEAHTGAQPAPAEPAEAPRAPVTPEPQL